MFSSFSKWNSHKNKALALRWHKWNFFSFVCFWCLRGTLSYALLFDCTQKSIRNASKRSRDWLRRKGKGSSTYERKANKRVVYMWVYIESAPHKKLFTRFFLILCFSFSLVALAVERELLSETEENQKGAVEIFIFVSSRIESNIKKWIGEESKQTEHENILLSRADRFVCDNEIIDVACTLISRHSQMSPS